MSNYQAFRKWWESKLPRSTDKEFWDRYYSDAFFNHYCISQEIAAFEAWQAAVKHKPVERPLKPSYNMISSVCLSRRHDFGLLPQEEQEILRTEALEWYRAWEKEFE